MVRNQKRFLWIIALERPPARVFAVGFKRLGFFPLGVFMKISSVPFKLFFNGIFCLVKVVPFTLDSLSFWWPLSNASADIASMPMEGSLLSLLALCSGVSKQTVLHQMALSYMWTTLRCFVYDFLTVGWDLASNFVSDGSSFSICYWNGEDYTPSTTAYAYDSGFLISAIPKAFHTT